MLSGLALWALLATTSHAAYVQFRNCYDDDAAFRIIPEGLRAFVDATSDAYDAKFHLVGNYANGTECDATSPLDLVPVFTVVDYNGAHQYPGRIVNTSCAKYGPLASRLRLEIVTAFNRSTFLDTFETTVNLTTHDGTPLLCANANLTPEVRLWTQLVSFWLPVLVFSVAALVASWPSHQNGPHDIFPDVQDRNNHRMARASEMLAYIQFIYFSGALSLRYPGFLQPLIGFSSWSTLMLPAGPVTNYSPYAGVKDGIYETNGTLTGAPGFVILTEITGSPVMVKNWFNTIALALIVLFFFFVAIHVRELLREQRLSNSTNTSQKPVSSMKERSWAVSRLFLSLFLLPLSAWSTYQLSTRRMLIQNSAVAILVLVLLLSSFWWTWIQSNSSADVGLFVIQGETRVRGQTTKDRARKYHALNIFSLMLFRGIILGGLQAHVRTQFGILLGCELVHLMCMAYWGGLSSLLSLSGVLYGSRLVLFSLHTAFLPGVTDLPSKILLGYMVLSWHLVVIIGIFLIPIFLDLVHQGLASWTARVNPDAEKTAPAMRVSSSSESDRSTKDPPGLLFSAAGTHSHRQYLADVILSREFSGSSHGLNHDVSITEFMNNIQGEDQLPEMASLSSSFLGSDPVPDLDSLEAQMSPKSPKIAISAIAELLLSKQNLAIREKPLQYDLNRPINEYFICSSHNTYLMGRQVLTRSTVQGYISALSHGCRSIEVDCWDGRDGQPIVKHGYSLTASIGFQDVINAINQNAFVASDFPLWISLEVHCSPRQKAIMARIMRETFGWRLVTEPLSELSQPLPSPSQLRGRILIKAKVAKSTGSGREPELLKDAPSPRQSQDQGNLTEAESPDSISSIESVAGSQEASSEVSQPQPSVNGPLDVLAVYGPGKRLPRPSKIDATGNFIYSVSEANFKSHLKQKNGEGSLGFLNIRHMLRVYPDASRIDSSNLSPLQYWRHGVQMAALNYQTNDLNMGLNQAMFNGGIDSSGYVLKPATLRQPPELISNRIQELRFSIDVLMTKDLCWPETTSDNASAYVRIKLLVADASKQDTWQTKGRTRSIPLQRHDIMFDSRLDFQVKTQYPSLVFLQWSVKVSSDTQGYPRHSTVASGMAKLKNLRQGYRLLPLKKSFRDEEDCGYLVCKLPKSLCSQDGVGSEDVGK